MEQPTRSIWENMKVIVQAGTDAVVSSTTAVGKTALIADSLANAGLLMANSNERIVAITTEGKEQQKLKELEQQFPDLDFEEFRA